MRRLNGLFFVDGEQHVDSQTTVDHASPHGTSRELYKGILGGHSRGVFNGSVLVRPDAQKTNAQQFNPNLLISDDAQINTKPTLEISADDVKCSHGSTVGRLDADALFYLRTRGVDEPAARQMLTVAYAAEIAKAIPQESLRTQVERLVAAKARAQPIGEGGRMTVAGQATVEAADRRESEAVQFDPARARRDFPILRTEGFVFLDSAASARRSPSVSSTRSPIATSRDYANIHRGVYELSARATANFEAVRTAAQRFIGAAEAREIVFVRNATEALNLVASTYGRQNVGPGDEVLITEMEHHSNIVPWQMLCEEKGAVLRVAPFGRPRRADAGRIREAARLAHEDRRSRPYLERARNRQSGGGDHPARSRARRRDRHRWSAGGPPSSDRRCRHRLRLLRAVGTQGLSDRRESECSTARRRSSKRCPPIRAGDR